MQVRRRLLGFLLVFMILVWCIAVRQWRPINPEALAVVHPNDPRETLAIAFSTYVGGSNEDTIRDVAVDSQGNIYITGGTNSPDFPTTPGAYDRTLHTGGNSLGSAGPHDVFVMKLSPSGQLIWSTYLGGPNYDRAYAIKVDNQGYVYITGRAGEGFPVTPGAFRTIFQGQFSSLYGLQDGFVAKLTPDGSHLVFASYTGGRDLAIDQHGDIYIATSSALSDFSGAYLQAWFRNSFQKTSKGDRDGIVLKVKSNGSQVLWATYLGGSGLDGGTPSIRVDSGGHAYYLCYTNSPDIPTTAGAYDRTHNGGGDLYLAKLSPDGSSLVFGTYIGGSKEEFSETHGLALDDEGNAYVAATTTSPDFPTTPGAFQTTYGGPGGRGTGAGTNYPGDAFVAKIAADGSQLLASTFLGGRLGEGAEGVAVDKQGNVYLGGTTYSDNFPVTTGAFKTRNSGGADVFAVKLSADLRHLLYATYVGGSSTDYGRTAAIDSGGNLYVAGHTQSQDWPTRSAFQTFLQGNWDGVLAKFIRGTGTSTGR